MLNDKNYFSIYLKEKTQKFKKIKFNNNLTNWTKINYKRYKLNYIWISDWLHIKISLILKKN